MLSGSRTGAAAGTRACCWRRHRHSARQRRRVSSCLLRPKRCAPCTALHNASPAAGISAAAAAGVPPSGRPRPTTTGNSGEFGGPSAAFAAAWSRRSARSIGSRPVVAPAAATAAAPPVAGAPPRAARRHCPYHWRCPGHRLDQARHRHLLVVGRSQLRARAGPAAPELHRRLADRWRDGHPARHLLPGLA